MERGFYVGDRRYAVRLEEIEKGREFIITVDGKRHHVFLRVDAGSGNLLEFVADNKPRRVSVPRRVGIDRIHVSINGFVFSVSRGLVRPQLASQPTTRASSEDRLIARRVRREEGMFSAPTPGKIVLIKVKEGDPVEEGDALLILESMKMETTLSADRSGVVGKVKVREGDSVSRGDILLSLK